MSNPILLFSGGVDSVLCLKLLVENGIIPTLLHVRTTKLTDEHETMILRNAVLLSPKSQLLVLTVSAVSYEACSGDTKGDECYAIQTEGFDVKDSRMFYPLKYGDPVYIGYYRKNDGPKDKTKDESPSPNDFASYIDTLHSNPKVRFPLEFFTRSRIDRLFMELPEEVRRNTVSSTRGAAGELGAVVVTETLEPKVVEATPNEVKPIP